MNFKFSANGKILERSNSNSWQGIYLNGSLPTSGKTAFCLRAFSSANRKDLDGAMLGIAVDGINRAVYTDPKGFLLSLLDGYRYGGAGELTYPGILSGASPGDIIRLVYDADANTLTFYRNGNQYSNAIPLTSNAINEKSKLRFYVMLYYVGQYATLL